MYLPLNDYLAHGIVRYSVNTMPINLVVSYMYCQESECWNRNRYPHAPQ